MEEMMIDIIMPLYNAGNFITQTLQKLEKQSMKDFNLIIINDGSSDKSQTIVENYIKHSRMTITLINQENQGEGGARNTGLQHITAKYVLFLDCDDWLHKSALEIFVNEMEKGDIDAVISSYSSVNMVGEVLKKYNYNYHEISNSKEIISKILYKEIPIGIGNTMIKSEILKKTELKFGKYKFGADFNFFAKLSFYLKKIRVIPNNLFFYVQNQQSVMHKKFSKQRIAGIESVEDIEDFYRKIGKRDLFKYELRYAYNRELMSLYVNYIQSDGNCFEVRKLLKSKFKFWELDLKGIFLLETKFKYRVLLFTISLNIFKKIYFLYKRLANQKRSLKKNEKQ